MHFAGSNGERAAWGGWQGKEMSSMKTCSPRWFSTEEGLLISW